MLGALIRTRFIALFYSFFSGAQSRSKKKVNSKSRIVLFALLGVYILASFLFMFATMFASICRPFYDTGIAWFYFSITAIIAFMLCFIGSIFTTQTQLFDAKDNELLLSMPVPPRYILLSRVIMLMALNYLFEALVFLPAIGVYIYYCPVNVVEIICFVIVFITLPFLSQALSSLVAALFAYISSKIQRKNIITTALYLIFLVAYFYFFQNFNGFITSLLARGSDFAESMKKNVFIVFHLGNSISDGNLISLLITVILCVVPFVLVFTVISYNFIRIVTAKKGAARIKYVARDVKQASISRALLRKEIARFVGTPIYMLNSGLGTFMLIIASVALVIKRADVLAFTKSGFSTYEGLVPFLLIMAICAISGFNLITAPSVSLEGKAFWLTRSLPVETTDILNAKANMHILFTLPPVLLASLVLTLTVPMEPVMCIFAFVVPAVFVLFGAYFGLIINIYFPKLDWISEAAAVKQGLNIFIAMFGNFAFLATPVILYFLLVKDAIPASVYLGFTGAFFGILAAVIYMLIVTRGKDAYEKLG